ncbi:hypothetical protein ACFQPA_21880 [Halomarina halobia]|uniref:hypothetical protein n=1 Tax=Halomarina halobia TaxID=3033386 RepID=UPI0023E8E4CE|nr:hypothetical protein [Halomarina sp. PSR21]
MGNDNVAEAVERLFDALEDLNRVHGQREELASRDIEALAEKRIGEDVNLSDVYAPPDDGQLWMALRHVDAAREAIAQELEEISPRLAKQGLHEDRADE